MYALITALLFALLTALSLCADTVTTIDFETVPALAPGPTLFTTAGPAQSVTVPAVATIGGGVVLGDAGGLLLSGVPSVTPPNIYATASDNVIGPGAFGLPSTMTITIPAGFAATQATVPVFNGMVIRETYVITAYDGTSQVAQQTFANVPGLEDSGYAVANLTASAMTSITIAPLDTTAWDFATDTITLRETPVAVPEPRSVAFSLLGIAGIAVYTGRRRRNCPRA